LKCRFCGTDIADKALICYRCGRATTDPKVAPPPPESLFKKRRSKTPWVIAALVVVLVALLLWYFLGVAPRLLHVADRPRPIIEAWLSASSSPRWLPHSSCSLPCRIARSAPAPADT
jgi:hypothetical protein